MLVDIGKNLFNLHIFTFAIGAAAFGIIHGIKKFRPHFPAGLLALVVTTGAVWLFQLQEKGVAIIGEVPSGLPHFILPLLDYETTLSLLGPTIVIALVSFAETYSVGKAISAETKQKVNVDQEFIGQGLANLIGFLFSILSGERIIFQIGDKFCRRCENRGFKCRIKPCCRFGIAFF